MGLVGGCWTNELFGTGVRCSLGRHLRACCRLGMKLSPSSVCIQAKTSEGVDALGENRAIACEAVVMLIHKDSL